MKLSLAETFFILISLGVTGLHAQCGPRMSPWIERSTESRAANLITLHRSGVEAIPLLISQIDNSREVENSFLANPIKSYAYFDHVYCGLVAAYLIEWLLGIEHPSHLADGDSFLGSDPSNYPYAFGRVTRTKHAMQIRKNELPNLRAAYSAWWESNKQKDISTLRIDWATGKRPLAGSAFEWH